jgi:hypothetical protein
MQTRSEKEQKQGGFVEKGSLSFQGREFSAIGAVVADDRVTVYLDERQGLATTWGGERLGVFRETSRWRAKVPGQSYRITVRQLRVTLDDGRAYRGKASTEACHVHAKRVAAQRKQG